jgi:hypothetical protein
MYLVRGHGTSLTEVHGVAEGPTHWAGQSALSDPSVISVLTELAELTEIGRVLLAWTRRRSAGGARVQASLLRPLCAPRPLREKASSTGLRSFDDLCESTAVAITLFTPTECANVRNSGYRVATAL